MSFNLLPDHLPKDVSFTEKSGFYALKDDQGHVQHFAYYEGGRAQGWSLTIQNGKLFATKVEQVISPDSEAPEEELSEDEVLGWVHRIVSAQGSAQVCSFCEKTSTEVAKLIAGPESFICNECVQLCVDILAEE